MITSAPVLKAAQERLWEAERKCARCQAESWDLDEKLRALRDEQDRVTGRLHDSRREVDLARKALRLLAQAELEKAPIETRPDERDQITAAHVRVRIRDGRRGQLRRRTDRSRERGRRNADTHAQRRRCRHL